MVTERTAFLSAGTDEHHLAQALEGAAWLAAHLLKRGWSIDLDFSRGSIDHIERLARTLHDYGHAAGADVETYALYLGSYLGEVLRGGAAEAARWVWCVEGEGKRPGLRCGGRTFFPHDRVRKRLTEGAEHDLSAYHAAFEAVSAAGQPSLSVR